MADLSRNRWPVIFGTGGRNPSEQVAEFIGIGIRIFYECTKFEALVKSQKSHIFIISEGIRIQLLQIVISVSSVRSVANCSFYEFIKFHIFILQQA